MVHVDDKGITDGLWRGETRCIGPRDKDADLLIMIWEELHRVHQEDIFGGGRARQSAPLREGKTGTVAFLEKFITEGNEKADEL